MATRKKLNDHELLALRYVHQWLWKWAHINDGPDAIGYSWEDWFRYKGATHHIATVDCGWYTLYIFEADTGDDGGSNIIYAWYCRYVFSLDREAQFKAAYPDRIVQEFDTMFATVYDHDEGGFQWQS